MALRTVSTNVSSNEPGVGVPHFVEGAPDMVRREPQRRKSFLGEKLAGALQVSLVVLNELLELGAMGLERVRRGLDGRLLLHVFQNWQGLC